MSPLTIRPATEADLPALMQLYAELSRRETSLVTEAQIRAWHEIQQQPHVVVLVAESGGAVVGTLQLALIAGLRNDGRPFGVIESVVVSETARRQGVARALLAEAEARARAARAYKLMLMTSPSGRRRWQRTVRRGLTWEAKWGLKRGYEFRGWSQRSGPFPLGRTTHQSGKAYTLSKELLWPIPPSQVRAKSPYPPKSARRCR
ncbi:GNAT family N-acetyltransferase [Deinococcus lacus]|uniref:GNAT family N-acetyltransferase n=1 Tax=Deinococcus lacus TaxID=392561 RepID=A0ABW1YGB5_9DEIO